MGKDKERHAEGIQVGSAVPKEEEQERKSDGEYNNGNKVRESTERSRDRDTNRRDNSGESKNRERKTKNSVGVC